MEERWGKLTLSGEEDEPITQGKELSRDGRIREQRSLLDKICANRSIEKEILKATMKKIWWISKSMIFKEVGKNLFPITFETKSNKLRAIADLDSSNIIYLYSNS